MRVRVESCDVNACNTQNGFCLISEQKMQIDDVLYLIIGQRVIVQKQSGRNVEGDENINRIMFVSGQYEEDAKHVQQPCYRVQEIQMSRSI